MYLTKYAEMFESIATSSPVAHCAFEALGVPCARAQLWEQRSCRRISGGPAKSWSVRCMRCAEGFLAVPGGSWWRVGGM